MAVRRFATLAIGVAVFMSVGVAGAFAQAETRTDHFEDSVTFADYVPCVSAFPSLEAFLLDLEVQGVIHDTETENGSHFHERVTGTFSAVPVLLADEDEDGRPDEGPEGFIVAGPREGESFTGTFSDSGSGNFNQDNHTVAFRHIFKVRGIGDEGTEINHHENSHITAHGGDPFEDPSAIVKVIFMKARCR